MTRVAIALGSNLGDRLDHLRAGLAGLRTLGTVIAVSSVYETAPIGEPGQGPYLNAAVLMETDLDPDQLMGRLLAIEATRHRIRTGKWTARTLDLDIVAHRAEPVVTAITEIPHPRAAERRFVMAPLTEIWPQAPVGPDLTAEQALARLPRGGVFRWQGDWEVSVPRLGSIGMALVAIQLGLIGAILVVSFLTLREPISVWRTFLGVGLALAGSGLVVSAALALGARLSALPDPRPGPGVIERGPFAAVRHPIYGGVLSGAAAMMVLAGSWWPAPLVAALVGLLRLKSGLEERALTLMFPDYPDYRNRVRRRFIPWIW
jgi:2-amino-4-hydroxy-6-hydroxymethyldihydropteridine diphosphokinase